MARKKTKDQYLEAMGIEQWLKKDDVKPQAQKIAEAQSCDVVTKQSCMPKGQEEVDVIIQNSVQSKLSDKLNNDELEALWNELHQQVTLCTKCALSKTRTNVVFGMGNRHADIMLIGEAPGENEDLQGEPFVGKAGMLLTAMLEAIELKRQDVYIANILKCRPPYNRDPLPQEVALCTPYLQEQIALIRPKIIIAVGRIAAQFLLNTTESMGRLRGKIYTYGEFKTPLFVMYHPAYLLRSPREKSKAYEDLLRIQQFSRSAQ